VRMAFSYLFTFLCGACTFFTTVDYIERKSIWPGVKMTILAALFAVYFGLAK
jgi:hypothetical protein